MEVRTPGAPAIPPRRLFPNMVCPPVPSRWGTCTVHAGHNYAAICKSCIRFLCKECVAQVPFEHEECNVTFLDIELFSTCEDLMSGLNRKMENTKRTMSGFHKTLSKKRDRMIKKRNQTVTEIERYFNALKEKIMRKLKSEETELLDHLNKQVSEQDAVINKNIEHCNGALNTIDEKRTMVANLARLCGAQRGRASVNFLKNIVKASDEMNVCYKYKAEIEDARDAFLVIRFFVDSETEQTVINSRVASVEVLNSRADHQDTGNLEVERINEASQNVPVDESHELDHVDDDDPIEPLRVALPPTTEAQEFLPPLCTGTDNSEGLPQLRVTPPVLVAIPDDMFDDEIACFSDTSVAEHTESNTQSDIETDNRVDSCESPQEELNVANVDGDITPQVSPSPEQSTVASPDPSVHSHSSGENGDTESSISHSNGDGTNNLSLAQPEHEDDPPPPYPGLPSAQPGPNELPPPYPGPPPPPYTQNPVPRRPMPPGRPRLHGQSVPTDVAGALVATVNITPGVQSEAPSTSGLKITKVFSVNEIHDKRSAGIFALAVVRSNCFVVVDRWNKKLKYFNPSGDSFGGLIFREEPWDVTLVAADLVAVTVPKLKMLYKIKVQEQSVLTTSTVSTLRNYACVSYHRNSEMFICGQVPQFGEPVIDVIGMNGGPILQTFRQDSDTRNRCMFSYPRYVKVTDDGIVIVCDWNLKCLMLFKLDGTFVGRYKGTIEFPLNEPTGMAYDPEKQEIYVIDSKYSSLSAAIHTVNLACECKDVIRWDNELRVAPAISPCRPGFAVGSKSGVVSLFTARHTRESSTS